MPAPTHHTDEVGDLTDDVTIPSYHVDDVRDVTGHISVPTHQTDDCRDVTVTGRIDNEMQYAVECLDVTSGSTLNTEQLLDMPGDAPQQKKVISLYCGASNVSICVLGLILSCCLSLSGTSQPIQMIQKRNNATVEASGDLNQREAQQTSLF